MGIIEAAKLAFEYKKYDENGEVEETIRAVDGVDLDVKKGDFVAILGHNGSGKSTLAKDVYKRQTYECDADLSYKQAYIDCKKEQIGIVKSPVGMPGRAIFNTFIKHGSHKIDKKCLHCLEHCNPKEIPYCITRALIAACLLYTSSQRICDG